ncbi:Bro-N domain-containing protein [Campylobacter sp. MOP7]|uniref:BRO-N domain-containing protein n=1 Tax=Campylobacter canis TaxID=3378588 RepID=UPI00387E6DAA
MNLEIFKNADFEIRVAVNENNEPLFCLVDVCKILELDNSRQVKTRLNQDGVITTDVIDSLGRTQQADFINEPNLYRLIFQSRKPEAGVFQEWVFSEVLPAIRKHGGYLTPQKIDEVLSDPDTIIKLATDLKAERAKRKELEQREIINLPYVSFAKSVEASIDGVLIGNYAKLLSDSEGVKIGQNNLF